MNKNKYILLYLLSILVLTSCGSKAKVIRADELSGEDFININIDESAKPISQEAASVSSLKSNKRTSSSKKQPRPVSNSLLNGEWIIIQAGEYSIQQDEGMPYIIFSDKEGRFYASNGCNTLNGDFKFKSNKYITFDHVLSTMMLCSDIGYESEISSVLRDGNTVNAKIEKVDNESYMTLYNSSNKFVMRLRRHNLEVINGQWAVSEIEGEEVDGDEVNVFFDIPELSIHGNTGCNYFNGVVVIDPNVPSGISFAQMGVTQKACPNQEIERLMLVGLEETYSYVLKGNNLYLKDADGKTRIKLLRTQ